MKVSEAIEKLKEFDQDAELHFCTDNHSSFLSRTDEVEDIYASTARYGILTENPTTVEIVVLDTRCCGI